MKTYETFLMAGLRRFAWAMILVGLTIAVSSLFVGCADWRASADSQAAQLQQTAAALRESVETAKLESQRLDTYIAQLPPGETRDALIERKAQVDAIIAQAGDKLSAIDAALIDIRRLATDGGDEIDAAGGMLSAVVALIPSPWSAVAGLCGACGLAVWRMIRAGKLAARNSQAAAEAKQAGIDLVKAIERAKGYSGVVNFKARPDVEVLNTMGDAAKALVDEAQGKLAK